MATRSPLTKNNVHVSGKENADKTLIFIHGFGTDQTCWHPVVADFAGDYRIVLLDNVGAGQADPDAFVQHHYLNLNQYAVDLIDVCTALDLHNTSIIGHSVGGMIGALASIRCPARFERLVMIGSSPRYLEADTYPGTFTQADLSQIYSAVMNSFSDWVKGFTPLATGDTGPTTLSEYFSRTLTAIPQSHVLTVLCSILQSDHRADLEHIKLPTLLLQSKSDSFVPLAVAEYLQQHIADCRLHLIDSTGHFPHIKTPEQVIGAIRAFFDEASPSIAVKH